MRSLTIALIGTILVLDQGRGDTMDSSRIQQLIERMDDSLVRGNIYQIDCQVCEKRTDAFYAHKRKLIELFGEMLVKNKKRTPPAQQDSAFEKKQASYQQIIRQFTDDLNLPREQTVFSNYSLDGTGFYLKQYMSWVDLDGTAGTLPTAIFVSDGKLMGSFYMDQSQAVIEPATERPEVPTPEWTETAYFFLNRSLTTYMGQYLNLSMMEENGDLVVTGERKLGPKRRADAELRINKATLTPESLIFNYHNESGALYQTLTKTWQYQNLAGLMIPKTVTDQEYKAVLNEGPALEKVKILTINQYNPIPIDAKAEFAKLLKSNFSVFDEISGTHYLSGNPGNVLDKLSK